MTFFEDSAGVPPELNHSLMIAGDLGESLVQAAAGYECVADMLIAELTAMGLNTSTTAMVAWQGPGGVMMEMTAAEFMAVCAAASAWIRVGQVQAAEVAAAHTAAVETMIPAAVCLGNRATQVGLVNTNWIGQNTPGIIALDAQYYGHFWVINATARSGYGGVVSTALGALSEPPPLVPTASDPLGPAVGAAQAAAQDGTQGGLQMSAKAADASGPQPIGGPSTAQGLLTSMAGEAGSLFGEFGSLTSAGQQLPSMLGQGPQMLSGLLGPLSSMQGLNGASAALAPEVGAPVSLGGVGALAGGGGGGGLLSGSSLLSTSFVRPANSFSAPNAPTLPAGWQANLEATAESQMRPAGMAGGGLYGAPAGLGQGVGGSAGTDRSARTMQVTARAGGGKGGGSESERKI